MLSEMSTKEEQRKYIVMICGLVQSVMDIQIFLNTVAQKYTKTANWSRNTKRNKQT
jgi:hypothetical protein